MKRFLYLITLICLFPIANIFGQVITVQGVLRDQNGRSVDDGFHQVTFKLYNADQGGTALWSDTYTSLETKNGVFNVNLGEVTPLNLPFDHLYYVGIAVENFPEMTPRIPLTNMPYAMSINGLDNTVPSTGDMRLKKDNIVLEQGGILFPDNTFLSSANTGTASVLSDKVDALIIADSDTTGVGKIKFQIGSLITKMVFDQQGDLGIGVDDPIQRLHVVQNNNIGNIARFGSDSDAFSVVQLQNTTNGYLWDWGLNAQNNDLYFFDHTNAKVRNVISNLGKNIINTDDPVGLHISGSDGVRTSLELANLTNNKGWEMTTDAVNGKLYFYDQGVGKLRNEILTSGRSNFFADDDVAMHIAGTGGRTSLELHNTQAGRTWEMSLNGATGELYWYDQGTSKVRYAISNIGKHSWYSDTNFSARIESSSTDGTILELSNTSNSTIWELAVTGLNHSFANSNNLYINQAGGGVRMLINENGNMGIGDSDPTEGRLTVRGIGDVADRHPYYYMNDNAVGASVAGVATTTGYSIWADGRMAASEFNAFSDQRIKEIKGVSNALEDLDLLKKIEITNYQMIDKIGKGNQRYKKVIAQQVKAVYPQAVSYTKDFIPNVYELTDHVAYDEETGILQLTTEKAHNFAEGDLIRLIVKDEQKEIEVIEVFDAHTFKVKMERAYEKVFVYGKKVDDFHTVDYEAIAMLNVSATQALADKVEALEKQNAQLKSILEKISNENTTLKVQCAEIQQLKAQFKEIKALLNAHSDTQGSVIKQSK